MVNEPLAKDKTAYIGEDNVAGIEIPSDEEVPKGFVPMGFKNLPDKWGSVKQVKVGYKYLAECFRAAGFSKLEKNASIIVTVVGEKYPLIIESEDGMRKVMISPRCEKK